MQSSFIQQVFTENQVPAHVLGTVMQQRINNFPLLLVLRLLRKDNIKQ